MITLTKNRLAIGCGYFVVFITSHGIGALAIPYYQMVLGIDPLLLAAILTIPVLLSAFISPVIGKIIGQATASVNGRKGIVIFSGWICAFSYGAIWSVAEEWHLNEKIFYLLSTAILFYVSATFLCIAIRCFAYEETEDAEELNSVMGFTAVFDKLGSIFYFWLFPFAQSSIFISLSQGVRYVGWSVSIFFIGILSNFVALNASAAQGKPDRQKCDNTYVASFPERYRPMLNRLLWITFIQTGFVGVCISMDFYVLVYHVAGGSIEDGAVWKGVLSTSFAVLGLISIPFIVSRAKIYGKKKILIFILALNCLNAALKWFIYQPDREFLLILDAVTGVWIWTALITIIPSMQADICYWVKNQTGYMLDSYIVAKHNWALNIGTALAILGSGIVLKSINFDSTLGANQSQFTLNAMQFVLSGGSLFFSLLSILILTRLKFSKIES